MKSRRSLNSSSAIFSSLPRLMDLEKLGI